MHLETDPRGRQALQPDGARGRDDASALLVPAFLVEPPLPVAEPRLCQATPHGRPGPHDPAQHPAIAPLLALPGSGADQLRAPDPAASDAPLDSARAETRLRQQLELATLLAIPGIDEPVARLLAGRVAALFTRHAAASGTLSGQAGLNALGPLAGPRPSLAICRRLLGRDAASLDAASLDAASLDAAMLARLDAAWPLAAPTECLLVGGGDERLAIDSVTGQNRYGCTPLPRPGVLAFASCTASSISPAAYRHAELCRRRMLHDVLAAPGRTAGAVIGAAAKSVREALLARWGLADIADIVLAASGTDAALLLTGLLCGDAQATTILFSPSETGSGVPEAARGRHFANVAADGTQVASGNPVDGFAPIALLAVPLRNADGACRTADAIASSCAAAVEAACADGGRAVLHAIDGSKTGLSAPGLDQLAALQAQYHGRLDIVVDACQARLPAARLRRYLEHGWPVMLTGSKFFGGPGFSGAVLLPRNRRRDLSAPPAGLTAYAIAPGGGLSDSDPGHANAGLVLRWEAALDEMDRFDARPAAGFAATLDRLAAATGRHIAADADLVAIDTPDTQAADRADWADWTDRRTVITFAVRRAGRLAGIDQLRRVHCLLNQDLTLLAPAADPVLAAALCQVGQPVLLGERDGQPFAGLRIAFGASHAAPDIDHEAQLATVFAKLRLILDLPA